MVYCFEAIIASCGFHVYKETSWSNAKVGDEVKVEVESKFKSIVHDSYSCMIKAKRKYLTRCKTVGHIPCEISRYVYYFIKQDGGKVYGKLKLLECKPSPIPSGGLEVPLLLKFESQGKWVKVTMERFVENFYSFSFTGDLVVNDEDDEEIDFETIDIENSNENDESEINEKDEKTVTFDDPLLMKLKKYLL